MLVGFSGKVGVTSLVPHALWYPSLIIPGISYTFTLLPKIYSPLKVPRSPNT